MDPPGLSVLSEQEPPAGGALQQEGPQIRHRWHTAKEQKNGCVSKLISTIYNLMLKTPFLHIYFNICNNFILKRSKPFVICILHNI